MYCIKMSADNQSKMLSASSWAISKQRAEAGRAQPDSAAVCLRDTSCCSTRTCAHMFPVEGHQASNYDEILSSVLTDKVENHKGVSVWMSSFKLICMRSWVWKTQSEEIFKIWIIRYSRVTPRTLIQNLTLFFMGLWETDLMILSDVHD